MKIKVPFCEEGGREGGWEGRMSIEFKKTHKWIKFLPDRKSVV